MNTDYIFISENFDEETGSSSCTLKYNAIKYTGTAKLSEEDKILKSKRRGCTIAGDKALLQILKVQRAQAKKDLDNVLNIINCIRTRKTFDPTDGSAKALYKELNARQRVYNKIVMEIEELQKNKDKTLDTTRSGLANRVLQGILRDREEELNKKTTD